jgi:signal transduction histidine kinase
MQPIENDAPCKECHDPDTRLLGMLLTDVSIAPYQAEITKNLRENLWWSAGAVFLTVFLVVILLNQFVIRRLEMLAQAITSFGQGQLHAPIRDETNDEIGKISLAFDDMATQVETREADNRALSDALETRNAQRGDLLKRLITAQEDERKRVARELHDDLGQTLGGMALHVKALEQSVGEDNSEIAKHLTPINNMIKDASDRMYDLIIDLRPSSLDDFGLVHALRSHTERVFKNGKVSFDLDIEKFNRRLPAEIETALFRVYQEALNNVVRHADATRVSVSLACSPEAFEGHILDDGKGFDAHAIQPSSVNPRGLGLLGMQERVMQCGGQIDIQSRPNQGTKISIKIPLEDGCG